MFFIYDLFTTIAWGILNIASFFNPKLKLFVNGRKRTFRILKDNISKDDHVVWLHAASLGEFEQGLPVIEKIRSRYPSYKILITFFSPSGYEVKKNTPVADIVTYLPMDTRFNVTKFLDITRPKLAIFVKYEIWPNYLNTLKKKGIPVLSISAIFRREQLYFKWYGGFMRKALGKISCFFVQDKNSKRLLETIDINNSIINGDTRLDRVSEILERDNTLGFMENFKGKDQCFVAGSTWPEDEKILIPYINNAPERIKFVLAPHAIKKDKILGLAGSFTKKTILYSNLNSASATDYNVLIIDNVGLLTKIYSYADIAYVGGGFKTGLHNTLEPAVFGIPVIIGPNYSGFKEAEDLVALKGILPISNAWDFEETMRKILADPNFKKNTGAINGTYITNNKGASSQIMKHINDLLRTTPLT